MREIKFRAWDKEKKEWADSNWLLTPDGDICEYNDVRWTGGWNDITDYVLMQYTGLKDKNGKEIYEGDIVGWKFLQTWHKNEVRWVGGGFVVTTSGFKDDLNEPQDLSLVSILNCEIIGNIYENPELLSK